MKKSELKFLIKEIVAEVSAYDQLPASGKTALNNLIAAQADEEKNANVNAQRLIGKTIRSINLNPKTGYMELSFSDGKKAVFGEVDSVYSFDIEK